jgi:hypothetical protein
MQDLFLVVVHVGVVPLWMTDELVPLRGGAHRPPVFAFRRAVVVRSVVEVVRLLLGALSRPKISVSGAGRVSVWQLARSSLIPGTNDTKNFFYLFANETRLESFLCVVKVLLITCGALPVSGAQQG